MRRILVGLTAGVLGIAGLVGTAGTADAGGGHGHGHSYHREYGHRFKGGFYYVGHDHPRWDRRVWDAARCRYHYWDPYRCCWYYWYPAGGCWYPDSYCP